MGRMARENDAEMLKDEIEDMDKEIEELKK